MQRVLKRKRSNIMDNKKNKPSYKHGDKYVPDSMPATGYTKFMFKNVIPKAERVIDAAKEFKRKLIK